MRYAGGVGVPKDEQVSRQYFGMAASKGHPVAQNEYASALLIGWGGSKDPEEAFKWVTLSANQGYAGAQHHLAEIYLDDYEYYSGLGLNHRDHNKAFQWFLKAATLGNHPSYVPLGELYLQGKGTASSPALAKKWFEAAAHGATGYTHTRIGEAYKKQGNYDEAISWFNKGVSLGEGSAMSAIADLYYYGDGLPKDTSRAFDWYLSAAQHAEPFSIYKVAEMYQSGDGTAQDSSEAAKWFLKCAEYGKVMSSPALYELGVLYETGEGVNESYEQAYIWYSIAASRNNDDAMRAKQLLKKMLSPAQIMQCQKDAEAWSTQFPSQ